MARRQTNILEDVQALRKRKTEVARSIEASIDSLADSLTRTVNEISQKEAELGELKSRETTLRQQAERMLTGGVNLMDMNIIQFPGGRNGRSGTRTDIKGKPLDLTKLRETVSHRFANTGEVVVGHLDAKAVEDLHGKPFAGSTAELVDALWKLDSGEGFYTHTARRGVRLNPLAVFKSKGRGALATEVEATV